MKKMITLLVGIFALSGSLYAAESQNLVAIKNIEQLDKLIHSTGKVTYVDVYSTYCPPCKALAPKFQKWADENVGKASFAKVNSSEVAEITKKYSIKGVPTILVFDEKGNLIDRKVGLGEIKSLIKLNL